MSTILIVGYPSPPLGNENMKNQRHSRERWKIKTKTIGTTDLQLKFSSGQITNPSKSLN
jgi:hypothetical protein